MGKFWRTNFSNIIHKVCKRYICHSTSFTKQIIARVYLQQIVEVGFHVGGIGNGRRHERSFAGLDGQDGRVDLSGSDICVNRGKKSDSAGFDWTVRTTSLYNSRSFRGCRRSRCERGRWN